MAEHEQCLMFCGERVTAEEGDGPLVIRGREAAFFLASVERLLKQEEKSRAFEMAVFDAVPFTTFLGLPSRG